VCAEADVEVSLISTVLETEKVMKQKPKTKIQYSLEVMITVESP